MQALILAGGRGTRLAPYTLVYPKPMLPVGGRPIIQTIVDQLSSYGYTDIIISLGYLGNYIRMYFSEDSNVPDGTTIRYVEEREPLGTAGPVAVVPDLQENFLVINGDILTTIDFGALMEFHREQAAQLSIVVGVKELQLKLGVVTLDDHHNITSFEEKPTRTFLDNMGIYIYRKSVAERIEQGARLDVNQLVVDMLSRGEKVCGFVSSEPYYWIDIGQHGDYEKANEVFASKRDQFLRS